VTVFSGRQQERQFLRAALERRASGLLVVRGPSGVGKTALIEQVLQDLTPAAPIIGRGKYADQSSGAGLRPIVDALSQAVDAALDRLYDPASGAASLRDLVGVQYGTLLAAGFTAAGLTGEAAPPATVALLSHEGTVRLVDALVRVLQWLEGFALPVVLFVDDWHRAPNEAVGFVHACSQRGEASLLKLVLAIRGTDATACPATASIVELEPLSPPQQFELLADLLDEPARAHAVMSWLGEHSSGLPFDLCQIALALNRAQAFVGLGTSQRVDPARVTSIDNRNIDNIIIQRAQTLLPEVLRLGVAAALWGDRAPLDILGRCLAQSRVSVRAAAEALQTNSLLRIDGEEIVFLHDRVRTSLLQVLDNTELRSLAHAMSDVLLSEPSIALRQTALRLKLVGGLDEVRDAWLSALFAADAASARLAAQFDLAADFGEAAWSIYQRLANPKASYRLAVLREACFAAAHRRQPQVARERCVRMIAAASNDMDLADAYERSVGVMRLAGAESDAWTFCREGLARFGVRLPTRVGRLRLLLAVLLWKLVGRKARRLVHHDARTEEALISFANAAGYVVWEHSPRHAAYMAIQMATRARLRGYDSALWLSTDTVINAVLKDYRAAATSGDRALAGLRHLRAGRGMTIHRAVIFGRMWRDPYASLIESARQIYDFCVAEGDLVGAANGALNETMWTWRSAETLEEVAAKLEDTGGKAARLGDARVRGEIALLAELVGRLRQPEPLSSDLPDDFVHGKSDVPSLAAVEYLSLVGDWPAILQIIDGFRGKRPIADFHPNSVIWRFYKNLARLKSGLPLDRSDLKFIARAAQENPTDHLGKLLLLEAEHQHRQGKKEGLRPYTDALEAMQKGSSRLELGLAAECAAAAARERGDHAAHERFQAAAAATWSAWGALGKLAMYEALQISPPIRERLALAEAQTAMAQRGALAKERFLVEVGHELRTPLQAMQGLLDLAVERPEEINIGEIREVFGSLKSVVDDLTELGALGAEAPLNVRPTDLAALIGSELTLVQEIARQKGLALSADLVALSAHGFDVDPDRVRRVVRNLLSNAIKYTAHGSVTLSANVGDAPNGEALIALVVEDTGPGIPEERLPHLFEPFDRAGRRDSEGLGLGLLLSRRVAERMGGSLTAENRPSGGARFVFSCIAAKGGPLVLQGTESETASRSLSILIVEDAVHVRRLMARLLVIHGHDVTEAETIAQGLEKVQQQKFDLLLLDLHLSDGDGLTLFERWPVGRERPPVIVLTAAATREAEDRVKQTGSILLRKPITAVELRSAISRACGGAEAAPLSIGFDAEMAGLVQEARKEIIKRAVELIDLVQSDEHRFKIRQHAHKLAGLASQFDAPNIAEAADRIEQACAEEISLENCLADLKVALAERVGR
jgi:signal transduction histidine kinase/ActR/RegA family two-component response regulator